MAGLEHPLMPPAQDELQQLAHEVQRVAAGRFPGHELEDLAVLPGGHSGLTHVATLAGRDGRVRLVVKSTPPGRPARGRHDVLRQARILEALGAWGGVPTPEVLFSAVEPIGLFGMRLVEGFATEPVMEEARRGESGQAVAAAWRSAVDVLVRLQRATPEDLGLDEPAVGGAQELERWTATMRAGGLDADARAVALAAQLAASAPLLRRVCLVHGDFRLGNMLQDDGRILALVDWEIWSLGDPLTDLGWLCLFADATNFPGIGRAAPGTPTPEAVVSSYRDGGADADPARVAWFRALACFKLAAIQAHNLRRHVEGRYHDPHQEQLVESTGVLLDRGLQLMHGNAA